ncbi:unnamed protein product [Camellia sinensis]
MGFSCVWAVRKELEWNCLAIKMVEIGNQRQRTVASSNSIGRCLISFASSSLTQLSLFLLPSFFRLALLGVTGVGRCCKRLVGVAESAPAFVFFNIIFIWGVYIGLVRQEFSMLVIGLCSILTTDPGYVTNESSHHNQLVESPVSVFEAHSEVENVEKPLQLDMNHIINTDIEIIFWSRNWCLQLVTFPTSLLLKKGQKNHVLFIILLFGFVFTKASYVESSSQFATKFQIMDNIGGLTSSARNLAISTMLFSLLQVLWQEHAGQTSSESEPRFTNPYDKGILWKVKEFLTAKE